MNPEKFPSFLQMAVYVIFYILVSLIVRENEFSAKYAFFCGAVFQAFAMVFILRK